MEGISSQPPKLADETYFFHEISAARQDELLAAFAALAIFLGKPYLPSRNTDFARQYERINAFCVDEVQSHALAIKNESATHLTIYFGNEVKDFRGEDWGKLTIPVQKPVDDSPDAIADVLMAAYRQFPAVAHAPRNFAQVLISDWRIG